MKILTSCTLAIMLTPALVWGQFSHIEVDEVENGGVVPGRTYRVYAVMESEGDVIDAIFGEEDKVLTIKASRPFYQHPLGGGLSSETTRMDVAQD